MDNRKILLVILSTFVILSGCWNYKELNDLAFTLAMGIDKEGKQHLITNQVLNPNALAGDSPLPDSPVTIYQESGYGVQEAMRKMTTKSTRKLFIGQLQIIILGEEYAKEGIQELLDHFLRDHDYGKDFYFVIAKGEKAAKILEVYSPLEQIPASKLNISLDVSSQVWGETGAVTMRTLTDELLSGGKEVVLTGIEIAGDQTKGENQENRVRISPYAQFEYVGFGVFKEDKLVGWLNESESKGYNYTQGNIKSTAISIPCLNNEEYVNVEVFETSEDTKFKLLNGNPSINMHIEVEGALTFVGCEMDFSAREPIQYLERETEKQIKEEIEAALHKAQKSYRADIFGFGNIVHRSNPTYWNEHKNQWEDIYENLAVNVEVKASIIHEFRTNKSFLERMKK
ncbi:Ger(x)C family spore germination protein [Alkalihalobacillus sp. BA299]|uniref:Ger(x)C family spore germination protein n=1 Tax=Alkalihalobacillus sp. BA299 TaxID=2815938 RepID=UPI001ADAD623|nr:Ger(x)C family spore germination protein [Alkalihalobacillus sp. BA299]